MGRVRLAVASLAVLSSGQILLGIPAAHAAPSWHLLGCTNVTAHAGAKICIYNDNNGSSQAQGRFINGGGGDVKNQGIFADAGDKHDQYCGTVITKAHTTSSCTRTLHGRFELIDYAYINTKSSTYQINATKFYSF